MKLRILIAVGLVLSVSTSAMDLGQMLDRALENDMRLEVLTEVLENTLLGIERAGLAPGRNFEFSTGDIRAAYSFEPRDDDPNWLITLNPSAALLLGREKETEISAELPTAIGVDTGELTVLPQVAIRQPLDKLVGAGKLTDAQQAQNRYAAEKARVDVLKWVKEVEQDLLEQLRTTMGMEQQIAEVERELAAAREARQEALTLETYAAGSARERRLAVAVSRLERQEQLQRKKLDLAQKELERIVGEPVGELPTELPMAGLELPALQSVAQNPDVYLASLAVKVEEARLEEEKEPSKPKFFIGSALGTTLDEDTEETSTTLAGTVDGEFEDFAFTTGVGGILETRSLFVSVGFSWSFRDKKIEGINLKERENLVDIGRLNLAAARELYFRTRELLALELADLEFRADSLEEQRTLAALELEEGMRSRELGLVTEQELDDLRWELEKLDYVTRALQLDKLIAASRIDALAALEPERE
ncbi:MAG: hypothetical protein JXB06_15855 [Spirochaetales bacterium]|nr:hypothetical protein [Spirochaetales bacterium]